MKVTDIINEGAPELLAAEMPLVRHIEQELAQHGYEKGTPEYNEMFKHSIAMYRKFGNVDQIRKDAVAENFADGKNPEHKGDSKRYHVPTKASVSTLRKVAKQGGRKGQLAHWMANMKAGRAKKESEGDSEGMPHLSNELIQHIIQQVGTEGVHAIVKSLQWGDGAAKELLQLIVNDLKQDISMEESVKQRLDPHCWKGKHKEGTKIKGGIRVNNCVPNESIAEGATMSKVDAHYRRATGSEKCANCTMFRQPNACTLVEGNISPIGMCDYFEAESMTEGYGKYWCSTDKKWKQRQGPKQTRNVGEAGSSAQQAAIAIAKKKQAAG